MENITLIDKLFATGLDSVLVKRVDAWQNSEASAERTFINCLAVTARRKSDLSLIILSFISTEAPKTS